MDDQLGRARTATAAPSPARLDWSCGDRIRRGDAGLRLRCGQPVLDTRRDLAARHHGRLHREAGPLAIDRDAAARSSRDVGEGARRIPGAGSRAAVGVRIRARLLSTVNGVVSVILIGWGFAWSTTESEMRTFTHFAASGTASHFQGESREGGSDRGRRHQLWGWKGPAPDRSGKCAPTSLAPRRVGTDPGPPALSEEARATAQASPRHLCRARVG
jgi:hypothetical protein